MILSIRALAIAASVLISSVIADVTVDPNASVSSLLDLAKSSRAQGHNNDALAYLDAAVLKDPQSYLAFFQRGATNLASGRNAQAKADFDAVLEIRPDFEGALRQRGKIYARNAEWSLARNDYQKIGDKAADDLKELEEAEGAVYLAQDAEKKQDWESCVNHAGTAILIAGTALQLRQLRARCRFERGEVQEGISDLAHVLQLSPGSIEPHLQISNMMFYSLGDFEKAIAQTKKCLHSDPESKPCKKLFKEEKKLVKKIDEVQTWLEKKQYASAARALVGTGSDETGLIDELKDNTEAAVTAGYIHENARKGVYISHVEKACEAYYSSNTMKKAEQWCQQALQLSPNSLYALLHKAKVQVDKEEFDAAIATLNTAKEHHEDARIVQEKLQEAQALLKRSKTKDYYKILGVSRDADEATIKKAYRKATKVYHPDKAMAKGVGKEEAEKKMAGINEAYEVLSDPDLKARFDRGEDPNDPHAGHPFQQGGNPFANMNFGGPGGQQQFVFRSGGGPKVQFSGGGFPGGGFPGGFPFGM